MVQWGWMKDWGGRASDGTHLLAWQLEAAGIKNFSREHRFHGERRWRIDLAFVDEKLAVEVEGAVFSGGRHSRGAGISADCEKYAELAILGWRLIRATTGQVRNGLALQWIERALRAS